MAQADALKSQTPTSQAPGSQTKSGGAYKTISEVSEELDIPQHVLRFWESHFPQVKPSRMRGSRRYYRPEDIEVLKKIKTLLYSQGYTIKGAKKVVGGKKPSTEVTLPPAPQPPVPVVTAQTKPVSSPTSMPDVPAVLSELRALKKILAQAL